MKIRIKGNSVRLRLSRSEVDLLGKEGYLEESTEFVDSTFFYAIQRLYEGKMLDAAFTDKKLTVFVPLNIMQEWTNTDMVGFSHHLPVGENKTLFLLIEKDFKCMDSEETEDQSDYYENPVKTC